MKKTILLSVFAMTFLLCVVDFSTRLQPEQKPLQNKEAQSAEQSIQVAFVTPSIQKTLNEQLLPYDVKAKPKTKPKSDKKKKAGPKLMSIADQKKQQGVKKALFSGEDKYSLIAIYSDQGKKFALLNKKHLVTGKTEPFRLFEGDKLADYTLANISSNQVEFVEGNRKVALQLFSIRKS